MKLRQAWELVGIKQKPKIYGFEVRQQHFEGTDIEYAQWQHPKAYDCCVQDSEVSRLRKFLKPGDVAIDIGAHMGDSTLPMALTVGQQGLVIALEPNAYVFPVLEANAKLNVDKTNIQAHPHAITHSEGKLTFSYGDAGFMNGGSVDKTRWFRWENPYHQTVQGVRLDEFLADHYPGVRDKIRFVKIDAEGYDYFVLQSMPELLESVRPYVQLEIMHGTPRSYRDGIFQLLTDRHYKLQRLTNAENDSAIAKPSDMYDVEDFDIFCSPHAV
ncbi:FkbM family methyltransferase [Aureliella helgolandensis]|uniref:Methyltransferase FkbM domain-containing protein n=1 Tax=Aureliella helgolandensis TaxID=2527968 RepID=A0A518G8A8_9BACT|nr:FkbM family methyltransferase [Aureliella helgolandensis]QDV24813.1 hypothetical protein Q31a_31350 [Aureliella helgolandensis]